MLENIYFNVLRRIFAPYVNLFNLMQWSKGKGKNFNELTFIQKIIVTLLSVTTLALFMIIVGWVVSDYQQQNLGIRHLILEIFRIFFPGLRD